MVEVNGKKCELPMKVWTIGIDMSCFKVVCECTIYKIDTEKDTMVMTCDDDDLKYIVHGVNKLFGDDIEHDYFEYTEENRKKLQDYCDKAYNDWREACKRQAERAEKYHRERNAKTKRIVKEHGYFNGTHTIIELTCNVDFFRWKKYVVKHINEDLEVFGVADDGDTMYISLDDLCAPTQMTIEREVDTYDKKSEVA